MNLTPYISEDIQLAVKRGSYWLDENHPNWAQKIDLEKLQMANCSSCVIGQAVGIYYKVLNEVTDGDDDGEEWSIEQGFQAPTLYESDGVDYSIPKINAYYTDLETLWTAEVLKRLS